MHRILLTVLLVPGIAAAVAGGVEQVDVLDIDLRKVLLLLPLSVKQLSRDCHFQHVNLLREMLDVG